MLASNPAKAEELAGLLKLTDSKVLLAAVQAATEQLSAQVEGVRGTVVHEARQVQGTVVREAQELRHELLKVRAPQSAQVGPICQHTTLTYIT